jgi:hypothetical protein
MTLETAFKIVIDYLFKEELYNNTFDHILSEEYANVGIAISAGKVGSGNAWFVAISLGSAELVSEIQMLNLINQVRADPETIWAYTDLTQTEVNDPNILSELIYGEYKYKPLFFDSSLSAYAQAHSFYTLNEMYPEEALSETQTPLERYRYYKYEGEVVQEHDLKKLYSSTEKNDRSVYKFFLSWIEKELKDVSFPCSTVIFSKDFEDVGYNITFQSGEIYDYDVSVFSFILGKKETNTSNEENAVSNTDQTSKIYGVLFSDNDGDDLYAPGEELTQKTVIVYDDEMQEVETAVTDNAGHFSMKLKTNRQYSFVATIDDVLVKKEGVFITSDQFVKLFCSPPPSEDDLLTVDVQ